MSNVGRGMNSNVPSGARRGLAGRRKMSGMARLPIDPNESWLDRMERQQAHDDAILALGNVADPPPDLTMQEIVRFMGVAIKESDRKVRAKFLGDERAGVE